MRRAARRIGEPGAIEMIEESASILRRLPLGTLALYYLGTAPFVLGFLYFWSDMSRGAMAYTRCAGAAFGLVVLFVGMKCAQAMFAADVGARIRRAAPPRWEAGRVARLVLTQSAFQPVGMLAVPLSLLLAIPFGWVYSFFQYVTVFGDGESIEPAALRARAARQASLWPVQGHFLIWFLSPWLLALGLLFTFGVAWLAAYFAPEMEGHPMWFIAGAALYVLLVWPCSPLGSPIALNVAVVLIALPVLLRSLLGWETVFTRGATYYIMSTTFLTTVYAGAYLCMDPLVKIAFALRAFYGESLRSGADLRAELDTCRAERRVAATPAIMMALLICLAATSAAASEPAPAQPPASSPASRVSPAALSRAIDEVLQRPAYQWRLPRARPGIDAPALPSFLTGFFSSIRDFTGRAVDRITEWLRRIGRWLSRFLRDAAPPAHAWKGTPLGSATYLLLFLFLAAVLSAAAILLMRSRRRLRAPPPVEAEPVQPLDLEQEQVDAGRLPPDEWAELAAQYMSSGEWRLALRALFLGVLARLAQRDFIALARFKSNRDYIRDVRRRAAPETGQVFTDIVAAFERVWYGAHPADEAVVRRFADDLRRMA